MIEPAFIFLLRTWRNESAKRVLRWEHIVSVYLGPGPTEHIMECYL